MPPPNSCPAACGHVRYDCGAVMLGQFLVAAVQNHIVPGVGQRGRFAVVRNQQPCDAAEVVECMDMTIQPVSQFHVIAGFCVGVVTAWQNGNKQIGSALFARDRVLEENGFSSQSTCMASPGLCWMRIVAVVTRTVRQTGCSCTASDWSHGTSHSILPTAASGSHPTGPVRGGCTGSRARHIDWMLCACLERETVPSRRW